jgi:hypothetical protein
MIKVRHKKYEVSLYKGMEGVKYIGRSKDSCGLAAGKMHGPMKHHTICGAFFLCGYMY